MTATKLMNIVYTTHTVLGYIPPLRLSRRQINAGPFLKNEKVLGYFRSLNIPREFDAGQLFKALPVNQKPDALVALVDSTFFCVPRNVSDFGAPKVLLLGDTHHGSSPIHNLINYSKSERYDAVAIMHAPQHLHWFLEFGVENVTSLSNVNVIDHDVAVFKPRRPEIVFVGQSGKSHARRTRYLDAISKRGLPLRVFSVPAAEAAKLFAESQIVFNCSMNGDLNMRVYEAIGAGGCLVTDRLGSASGLYSLFREGEHFFDFSSEEEMLRLLERLLDDPALCLKTAKAGRAHYMARYNMRARREQLLGMLHGSLPAPVASDPRADRALAGFGEDLASRLDVYEFVQNQTARGLSPVIGLDASLGLRKISDYCDLPSADKVVCDFEAGAERGALELLDNLFHLFPIDHYRPRTLADEAFDVVVLSASTILTTPDPPGGGCAHVGIVGPDTAYHQCEGRMREWGLAPLARNSWVFSPAGAGA